MREMVQEKYKNIGMPEDTVIEECSELIKAICKAKRFGWFNSNPITNITNIENVLSEINDVLLRCEELNIFIKNMIINQDKMELS